VIKIMDKHFLRPIVNIAEEIQQIHFDFLTKRVRKSLMYYHEWKTRKYALTEEEMATIQDIDNRIDKIAKQVDTTLKNIQSTAYKKGKEFINDKFDDVDDKREAQKRMDERLGHFPIMSDAIESYYRRGVNWLDIVFDKQFLYLYGIKLVNIGLFFASVYVSRVIFKKKYQKDVFEMHRGPSSLFIFLGMIFGFFTAFNVFMLLFLILLSYLFHRSDNFSFLGSFFIYSYVVDFVLSTCLMGCLYSVLTYFVSRKRYFNYKFDGYKTIEGLGRMLFIITAWISLTPFFYAYWIINKETL